MDNKLPKLFKKSVSKEHLNNTKICYTSLDNELKTKKDIDYYQDLTVEEKLKKLFKSTKYIFNIGVIIKTKNREYDTKIIGKVKNSVITENSIEIPIVEIEDIIIKDRI